MDRQYSSTETQLWMTCRKDIFVMKSQFKNKNIYIRFIILGTFTLVFLFTSLSFKKTTNAGFISFVKSVLVSEQVSAKTSPIDTALNSQTTDLLRAHTNIDPTSDILADAVPVSNGDLLVADIASSNQGNLDTSNMQISIYTVQAGDSLSGVAKMFRVSVNTILWANSLTSKSILKPGQTLVILPISGINHTIVKGDTILSIAKQYNASLEEILSYNDLNTSSLLVKGQKIIIPDAELKSPTINIASTNPIKKNSTPNYSGYYSRPVKGGTKTQGIHGHNGIDIADKIGTPIYAAASGTVIISTISGWNGGYGNYVIISHPNGTQTLYGHLSKDLVKVGDYVTRGQKIALMGSTGKSTGSHLHFEIRGAMNPF